MVNGTVTMEVALKALGIGWGDEVIVPALTFAATAYAADRGRCAAGDRRRRAASAGRSTRTRSRRRSRRATRAIMPVHLGQQMADMDRLAEIADRHGLAIVEDCAHAHGQQWGGRGAGCIGAFGSFSHQSTKILTAGEGGTLLTSDEALARRAHSIIDCGRPKDAAEQRVHVRRQLPAGRAGTARCSCTQLDRFEAQRARARDRARGCSSSWPAGSRASRINPIDPRITRWSFYRYLFRIDPDAFAGATQRAGGRRARGRGRRRPRCSTRR